MKRILLSVLVIGILLLSACGAPSETPSPTSTTQAGPQLIKEWRGTGIKTTEPFTINTKPWVISWANNLDIPEGESTGYLQIMVYSIENPDSPIAVVVNTTETAANSSYVDIKGTFYLQINAGNTQWTAKVWDYKEQ